MLNFLSTVRFHSFLLVASLAVTTLVKGQTLEADFCWKDSYGRGVGAAVSQCPGRQKIGALCYSHCPRGTRRVGFDCHSVCPSGFQDTGMHCRLSEYGRGGGYPWQWGDWPFDYSPAMRRCEQDHGSGSCEMWGLIWYPKCRSGYHPVGCCLCRPDPPNCPAHGLNWGVDLSCAKRIHIGDPIPMSCASNQQYDAGLCYSHCQNGFTGIGPVCWGQPPQGWVDCGFGAASSGAECAQAIADQIVSIGEAVLFIGSLGTSSTVTPIVKGTTRYNKVKEALQQLGRKIDDLVDSNPDFRDTLQVADKTYKVSQATEELMKVTEPEDMVRLAALVASLMDPTGVSSVIASFTYPVCSRYADWSTTMRITDTEPMQVASPTTPVPTPPPTLSPTAHPSLVPTSSPTTTPTAHPSPVPTLTPTTSPTRGPSPIPTTLSPISNPTAAPSPLPTPSPSMKELISDSENNNDSALEERTFLLRTTSQSSPASTSAGRCISNMAVGYVVFVTVSWLLIF